MNASARSNTHRLIDSRVSVLNSAMSCLKWIRSTTHNVAIEYRRAEGQNDRLRRWKLVFGASVALVQKSASFPRQVRNADY